MKSLKRLWIPVLLGVLLVVTLVGVAGARPNARPQEQAWRVLTVPAQACIPELQTTDHDFDPTLLKCLTRPCRFVCPLDFPAAGEQAVGAVNVKRVTMYAFDNDGTPWFVGFSLMKTHAPSKAAVYMAGGTTVDSAADPQTVMDMTIDNNPIYRVQAPYISLLIDIPRPGGALYGWFIHYIW